MAVIGRLKLSGMRWPAKRISGRIKQIHVAQAAFHEEKNHPLGFGRKVRLRCMRIGGGEAGPRQHAVNASAPKYMPVLS